MARFRIVALIVFCGALAAAGAQEVADRSWTPGVQKAPEQSPPLSPEEEMKHFYLPPGYHVEVVAAEPIVQDPVAIDWDADGRIWVVEYPEYVRDLEAPEPNLDPIGRIAVLEDTDNDGAMDKRTVFADGLIQAAASRSLDHGILVDEPPNIWLMKDTNGDLQMDTKDLVATGHGRREASVEVQRQRLDVGARQSIHFRTGSTCRSASICRPHVPGPRRCRADSGASTQDDAGRIYRNHNESVLHVDLVPTPYFARNPTLLRTRGSHEALQDHCQQHQRRLAGPSDPGNQPRLPAGHPAGGWHARAA